MRISVAEPGGHGSWVAASNDKHLVGILWVDSADEVCQISQGLLRIQVGEVLQVPSVEWLRVAIETMLKHHKACVMRGSKHEWEETSVGHSTAILTTDVDEHWASTIPVLVAYPVALSILSVVQEVEVIDLVHESLLLELVEVDGRPVICDGGRCKSNKCRSECADKFHISFK